MEQLVSGTISLHQVNDHISQIEDYLGLLAKVKKEVRDNNLETQESSKKFGETFLGFYDQFVRFLRYFRLPTLNQEERKMEQSLKNFFEQIINVQNQLKVLPKQKNKMGVVTLVEIRGEIQRDFSEELGEKYEQFFDQIITFAETVT